MSQQENLDKLYKSFEKVTDELGKGIDSGILETVVLLNAFEIKTTASCEGHTNLGTTYPWVEIYPTEPIDPNWTQNDEQRTAVNHESMILQRKLIELLNEFYAHRTMPFEVMLGFEKIGYGFRLQSNGASSLGALAIEDMTELVDAYKLEMKAFTEFLQNIYAVLE